MSRPVSFLAASAIILLTGCASTRLSPREAFLEGVVLFIIVRIVSKNSRANGVTTCAAIAGYGLFRFLVEFVRQPDAQLGLFFGQISMGQMLSLPMFVTGITAAVLWEITRRVLIWFYAAVSMVNVIYGSIAIAVVALLSIEVVTVILLLGAQVIAELEREPGKSIRSEIRFCIS